jgi:hypothetical protein
MENYYNKNILFLSCKLVEDVKRISNNTSANLSSKYRNLIIKNKIINIIYYLTGQHVFDFVCEIDSFDNPNFYLFIYDMDKKSCNVLYNYDFEYYQKIKDRKKKIEKLFIDE